MDSANKFQTLVFFDLETTGLRPLCRITELSMVAVLVDAIDPHEGNDCRDFLKLPRVLNKLTLCFHPMKPIPPNVSDITGLDNLLLEKQKDFDETTRLIIKNFLQRLYPPVCLIAHNGNNFDYPILMSEWFQQSSNYSFQDAHGNDIFCSDSLPIFRKLPLFLQPLAHSTPIKDFESSSSIDTSLNNTVLDNSSSSNNNNHNNSSSIGTQSRFRLSNIFEREFSCYPPIVHGAEADCLSLLKIVWKRFHEFFPLLMENCQPLNAFIPTNYNNS